MDSKKSKIGTKVKAIITSPNNSGANENPIRHISNGSERQQLQSRNTSSLASPKTPSSEISRDNAPHSYQQSQRTVDNNTAIGARVFPLPKLDGDVGNLRNRVDAKMSYDEEVPEAWRKHGKLFRANIVLADEDNGGAIFTLSDTCAIERYYRVADRVLDQFLSSNIAERHELIECYLIGNRLFKFLSVVLPTHHQYFSADTKLEELRNRSESQLLELLEYMEELELMIDEMEYNRYILEDLTPSEPKRISRVKNLNGNEVPQEVAITDGNFVEGSSESIQSGNSNYSDLLNATELKVSNEPIQEKLPEKQSQQVTAHCSNQRNVDFRGLRDSSIKANYTGSFHETNGHGSPNQHQILKQRIAAVLAGNNDGLLCVNKCRSRRSTSSITARLSNSSSANIERKFSGSISDKDCKEFLYPRHSTDSSTNSRRHFPGTSILNDQQVGIRERKPFHDPPGDPPMSWDVDFSQYNVFSSEKAQGEDFVGLKSMHSNTEDLLHDPNPRGQKQVERPKSIPKIKDPPISFPRSVWSHSQVNAARSSSTFEVNERRLASSAVSECSSDIFYSLENPEQEMKPVKTKIEQRLERAMGSHKNVPVGKDRSLTISDYENSSLLEVNSQRKLLNQFRGCVRFLLD